MALRNYQPKTISFSYNVVRDGGAIGKIPLGIGVTAKTIFTFMFYITHTNFVGPGASINLSMVNNVINFDGTVTIIALNATTALTRLFSDQPAVSDELAIEISGANLTAGAMVGEIKTFNIDELP